MIFIHADLEENVVENDLTRINLSKVVVTGAEPYPVKEVNITVSDGAPINVYNEDQKEWYLDWEYSYTADIIAENQTIYWSENGVDFSANLTLDTYTLPDLLTEIATQMNAASTQVFSLTLNQYHGIEVAWTGGAKVVLNLTKTSLWVAFGFIETVYTKPSGNRLITSRLTRYLPKAIKVEIITEEEAPVTPPAAQNTYSKTYLVKAFSEQYSGMLNKDADLQLIENDILQWVPRGKNTFKSIHLQVVNDIIEWFDRKGFVNLYDEKFVISDFYDPSEISYWAKYQALYYIFNSNNNAKDDIFAEKAEKYKKLSNKHRRRIFRVDLDSNNTLNFDEIVLANHIKLVRY